MKFKNKLFLISFCEGAAVMVAEICGAKLLAPFFGSSLYVWSSVMAITLGGLASGYFIGGRLSQKENKQSILFYLLLGAFCFLALMPYLSKFIFVIAYNLPLIAAVIFSSILIIFPSMLLMGTTSPLLISLLTSTANESGLNSGKIYSISTVGGILSTFLCGFYFIPTVGISYTLIGFSLLLALVSLLLVKKKSKKQITLSFITILSVYLVSLNTLPKSKNCIYKIDGILGKIEVKDEKLNSNQTSRILLVNTIIQSEMDLKTKQNKSNYISIFENNLTYFQKGKALVLGLGGGLSSNILVKNGYSVTGIEFDNRIIEIAKNYFYLDSSVKTICSDARLYINTCTTKYDLVMIDLYKAEEQPSHVLTLESLNTLKGLLTKNGVIIINNHGYLEGEKGLGSRCLIATLKKCNFHIKICSTNDDENYRNLLILASTKQITDTLINECTPTGPIDSETINTDNRPVLEKLNAEANKAWRLNYLKNYILINN